MDDFKWRHFEGDFILQCVRWYCRYGLSYRDIAEMMEERGIKVHHTTIYRWVQRYAPEMEKRLRWYWRHSFDSSWRVDTRSMEIARRFLSKTLKGQKSWDKPRTINTDKNPAYGAALDSLKQLGKCDPEVEHRQVKYLNNRLEADHGKLKRLIKPVRGFKSMKTANATIKGFELMRIFKKGQMHAWSRLPGIRGEVYLIEKQFGIHNPVYVQERI